MIIRAFDRLILVISIALALISVPAHADTASTSDVDEGKSARLGKLVGLIYGSIYPDDASGKQYCIPSGTQIAIWDSKTQGSPYAYLRIVSRRPDGGECTAGPVAQDGSDYYKVDATKLRELASSTGWVMGLLAIPYKYYLWGDRSIVGNTSAAWYGGYQFHDPRSDTNGTVVFLAGLSSVQVPQNSPASTTATKGEQAFTYGVGVFVSSGDGSGAQLGMAIGRDLVSRSIQWTNNGHGWLAFQVGVKWF